MTDHPEIAPFVLSDHAGTHSLLLTDFDGTSEVFEARGYDAGGYAWQGVADAVVRLRAPHLRDLVRFDPEGSMFCAYGTDRAALVALGGLLAALVADPAALAEMLDHVDPDMMD